MSIRETNDRQDWRIERNLVRLSHSNAAANCALVLVATLVWAAIVYPAYGWPAIAGFAMLWMVSINQDVRSLNHDVDELRRDLTVELDHAFWEREHGRNRVCAEAPSNVIFAASNRRFVRPGQPGAKLLSSCATTSRSQRCAGS